MGLLPLTHEVHTGLVQLNSFAQGLCLGPNLCQLARQVLHQGQQLSPDVVPLDSGQDEASDGCEDGRAHRGLQTSREVQSRLGRGRQRSLGQELGNQGQWTKVLGRITAMPALRRPRACAP